MFQYTRLFPRLDGSGNLAFAAARAPAGDISYAEVIDTLSVRTLLNRSVDSLSGGAAKRVAIARPLLSQPELLMMDEPRNGPAQSHKTAMLGSPTRLP